MNRKHGKNHYKQLKRQPHEFKEVFLIIQWSRKDFEYSLSCVNWFQSCFHILYKKSKQLLHFGSSFLTMKMLQRTGTSVHIPEYYYWIRRPEIFISFLQYNSCKCTVCTFNLLSFTVITESPMFWTKLSLHFNTKGSPIHVYFSLDKYCIR